MKAGSRTRGALQRASGSGWDPKSRKPGKTGNPAWDMDAHDRAVEDKSRACVVAWVQAVLPWAG